MQKAFICGLAGPRLTADERDFTAAERPAGLILFTRNCENAEQMRRLVGDFLSALGTDRCLVLIDQEGGRVQRLRPPLARALPPAAAYAAHFEADPHEACEAAFLIARLVAEELAALDINTNCAPVLDVPVPGAHDIIGNRAYGRHLDGIIGLGRAVAQGLMAGGILPVIKHIPGHGRAMADSHLELPVVATPLETLAASDLVPFAALADLPAAMTAHVVFRALDADRPASTSPAVTQRIIRGRIGFDGLLMSDDLSMRALTGTLADRARAVLGAGSDLALHCNGDLAEMREVAAAAPALQGEALRRFETAIAVTAAPRVGFDVGTAEAWRTRLLGAIG